MEQEPIVSKSKIMRLASDQVNDKSNADRRDGPEKETTLDASSLNLLDELCNASKEGDMEKIESLVRNFGAPINLVDSWQCTPLYYACLCGHYEVVKFLLENGAQCDPNTFTGERCLYGALNDKIRDLLRSYKFSKAVNENQPYLQFLTDMYNNHPYDDLTFLIRSKRGADDDSLFEEFPVQRFVLAARSSYFRQQLLERWRNEPLVTLSSKLVDASAFKAVLGYLYTGQLLDTKKDILENIVFVCKHLELPELQARCEHILSTGGNADKNANRAQDAKEMAKIRSDYERFLGTLLQNAMHIKRDGHGSATATRPWQQERQEQVSMAATFADIGIVVDNIMFPCHRACLCRSEYFKIMLQGNFSESDLDSSTVRIGDEQVQLPLVDLHDVAPETFSYVLEFLYTDRCTIPAKEAYDVLLVADMLFLDRLKSIASIAITNQEKPVMDIYDLIRTAIELNVDRLEQWCTRYFAEHLDDFINEPEFLELIRESAQSITGRQETDSIPFIDDLRYYLGKIYCIFDDDIDNMNMEGRGEEEYRDTLTELEAMYNQKLELLDRALESIGLEA